MIPALPAGEYAIVELLGHVTLIGRISQADLCGIAALSIEVVFRDQLLPPTLMPPRSIYSVTACTSEHAIEYQAPTLDMVPQPLQIVMPDQIYAAARAERDALRKPRVEDSPVEVRVPEEAF